MNKKVYRVIEIVIDVLTLGLALISKWANKEHEKKKKEQEEEEGKN